MTNKKILKCEIKNKEIIKIHLYKKTTLNYVASLSKTYNRPNDE